MKMSNMSKMAEVISFLILLETARKGVSAAHLVQTDSQSTIVVTMPPVQPTQRDEYICFGQALDLEEGYFYSVETRADRRAVHHAGVCFCEGLVTKETTWTCTNMTGQLCTGSAVTVGGWDDLTKNNGLFRLPDDVGFRIGKESKLKYVVFEVHFRGPLKDPSESAANVTLVVNQKRPTYEYQMYVLSNTGYIPASTEHAGFLSEVGCPWIGPTVKAFSYVIHTHHHGLLVEGYLIRNGRWILLGSHLTIGRTKRRYTIPGGSIDIREGDILAARCLYINRENRHIAFGDGIDDEMCNFMIDFAYRPGRETRFDSIIACNERTPDFSFCQHEQTAGIC